MTDLAAAEADYARLKQSPRSLDITRGKPAADQLDLANGLDGILEGDYLLADGTDVRNYGGITGIPEARALGGAYLDIDPARVIVGGNSSLQLMGEYLRCCLWLGAGPDAAPWSELSGAPIFLCPVPGYDRHFALCEALGVEMIPVPMNDEGPEMDVVEQLIADEPRVRGIWCVPRYSNPSGLVYSDAVVERFANLGKIADPAFRIFWDDAYHGHHLTDSPRPFANLFSLAEAAGTLDSVAVFASTSKITFAGSGISFLAMSTANLEWFEARLGRFTIGPDKVNQLRHVRFLRDADGIRAHMQKHAALVAPKFAAVGNALETLPPDFGSWQLPEGGYFVLFRTQPGLASQIVGLAAEAGVKLTPAGATHPYGNDPADEYIRIAPTFATLDELEEALSVFVACVRLATLRAKAA